MKRVRVLLPVSLSVLCLVCIVQSMIYGMKPEHEKEVCIVRLDQPYKGGDAGGLQEADSDYDSSYTLWGEQKECFAVSPKLGRKSRGTVLTISGKSGLVMDSSRELGAQQKEQCLIDDKMAWNLYGSMDAAGQILTVNGKEYQVAGRLYHAENTVLIQQGNEEAHTLQSGSNGGESSNTTGIGLIPGEGRNKSEENNAAGGNENIIEGTTNAANGSECSDRKLNYASVMVQINESREDAVKRFEKTTGLGATEISNHLYQFWGETASRVMQILLLIPLFYEWGKLLLKSRRYPVLFVLLLAGGIFILSAFFWIMNVHPHIPGEYLPSRWSDFEFWPSLWKRKCKAARELMLMEKTLPLVHDYENCIRSVCYSVAALLLAHVTFLKHKIDSEKKLFLGVLISLTITFVIIVSNSDTGSYAVDIRMVWLFIPAWLTAEYLLTLLQKRQAEK
ncbi:ABC transporter permease [Faecalicatena sp. AGMB00832]|uniref:ABC transporter permease n=1 Tax=Faecalicatena faecalis TaxID=2726362 RepID=A0ABS6D1G1_9FIRM|nr:ABC transporter permease [Faecalicatena faecalis]MBU3875326.1 ABC transporter permease [Faecalicatena faecalis]